MRFISGRRNFFMRKMTFLCSVMFIFAFSGGLFPYKSIVSIKNTTAKPISGTLNSDIKYYSFELGAKESKKIAFEGGDEVYRGVSVQFTYGNEKDMYGYSIRPRRRIKLTHVVIGEKSKSGGSRMIGKYAKSGRLFHKKFKPALWYYQTTIFNSSKNTIRVYHIDSALANPVGVFWLEPGRYKDVNMGVMRNSGSWPRFLRRSVPSGKKLAFVFSYKPYEEEYHAVVPINRGARPARQIHIYDQQAYQVLGRKKKKAPLKPKWVNSGM